MNLFNKIETVLFNIIIIFNVITNTENNEICSADIDCNNCNKCIIGENTDILCEYGNLFCNNNNIINFFSEQKLSFINYYRQKSETNSICGEQSININTGSDGNTVIILGNENKNYLKENSLHCNYEIKNIVDQKYNAHLSLSLISYSSSSNHLSFSIYIVFPNSINIYTDYNLRINEKIIEISDNDEFSILLDIHTINNYSELIDIQETLNIKINKKYKKTIYSEHIDKIPQYEENEEESSNNGNYKVICIVIAGIIGLIIIIIFIIRICLKRHFCRERTRQENMTNQIVNINIENNHKKEIEVKKKIELLFNTKFSAKRYSSNMLPNANTSCSICLENFVKNKSMVSLTSCNHIFHYMCLKKWSQKNTQQFKCPNCNNDFLKDDEPIIIYVKKNREEHENMNQNLNFNNNMNFLENINNYETLRTNSNLQEM